MANRSSLVNMMNCREILVSWGTIDISREKHLFWWKILPCATDDKSCTWEQFRLKFRQRNVRNHVYILDFFRLKIIKNPIVGLNAIGSQSCFKDDVAQLVVHDCAERKRLRGYTHSSLLCSTYTRNYTDWTRRPIRQVISTIFSTPCVPDNLVKNINDRLAFARDDLSIEGNTIKTLCGWRDAMHIS